MIAQAGGEIGYLRRCPNAEIRKIIYTLYKCIFLHL